MTTGTSVGVAGVFRSVATMSVGVAGVWRPVAAAWVGIGGVWRPTYSSLAVTILAGAVASGHSSNNAFGANTATPVGGIGPFTYQWHESDDTLGAWMAQAASQSQTVSVLGVTLTNTSAATYYCVVTDTATGKTATSATALYQWTHN